MGKITELWNTGSANLHLLWGQRLGHTYKLEPVFIKHYATNIWVPLNMAKFAVP